jgi:hypothetical protein
MAGLALLVCHFLQYMLRLCELFVEAHERYAPVMLNLVFQCSLSFVCRAPLGYPRSPQLCDPLPQ